MATRRASIVFFYFGDSYLPRLGQETVPVSLALEGYDRSVLLHFDTHLGPFEVSKGDEKHATVVELPTVQNLTKHLSDLKTGSYEVDLFVFSHGGSETFRVSQGTYDEPAWVSTGYIENHVEPMNLRAVWQCNCYGSSWNPTWKKLGAKVSAGTSLVNFYPQRFGSFAKKWKAGTPFGEAISESDSASIRTIVQAYLLADAMTRLKEWGGSVFTAPLVLGKGKAAKDYFTTCWLGDEFDASKSGKVNMNDASKYVVDGDGGIRF